jgi:hypothetical protein
MIYHRVIRGTNILNRYRYRAKFKEKDEVSELNIGVLSDRQN